MPCDESRDVELTESPSPHRACAASGASGALRPFWMRRLQASLKVAAGLLLAACSSPPKSPAPPVAVVPAPTPEQQPQPGAKDPLAKGPNAAIKLPPPEVNHSLDGLRKQAARRLIAANPDRSYLGAVPAVLLAIPVLEVELRSDGSVRRVNVLRKPGQAPETLQMAIDAIHRAAPFGDVSRLPEPRKFNETFLFNNDRRFKPRTLDGG